MVNFYEIPNFDHILRRDKNKNKFQNPTICYCTDITFEHVLLLKLIFENLYVQVYKHNYNVI